MLSRYIVTRLVVPFAVATTICAAIAWFYPQPWVQDVALAAAGSFFSVVLAALVVDRIIAAHERQRWAGVQEIVGSWVDRVATVALTSLRVAFGIEPIDLDRLEPIISGCAPERRSALLRLAEEVVHPALSYGVVAMTAQDWKTLSINLSNLMGENDRLLSLFGERLDPAVQAEMLNLADATFGVLATYRALFDVLGVPEDQRRPNAKMSPQEETRMLNSVANSALSKLNQATIRLLNATDKAGA